MKTKILIRLAVIAMSFLLSPALLLAQQLNKKAFELINLDYPELANVKKAYNQNDLQAAAEALLVYYQNRSCIKHP